MTEFIQESAVPHVNRMEEVQLGMEPEHNPVWDGKCSMCNISIDQEDEELNEDHYQQYGNYCKMCDRLCDRLARWRITQGNDDEHASITPDEFSTILDKRRSDVANGEELD